MAVPVSGAIYIAPVDDVTQSRFTVHLRSDLHSRRRIIPDKAKPLEIIRWHRLLEPRDIKSGKARSHIHRLPLCIAAVGIHIERDIIANRQANSAPIGTLPLPVIIPQRRPRFKSRGFVRAYSPVLQDVGIDQETFLRFLKNFHASSQANPCFNAIIVAATVAGFVPEPIVMAVTTAVQVAAGVGKEMDSRRKTNNFLDRMNETLFKPAGCYAFIMKYKPDAEIKEGGGLLARLGVKIEEVDFSASKAVAKYDAASQEGKSSSMSAKLNKMRLTSGKTMGSLKMVEAAPLIYPEIDEAIVYSGKDGQETFKDKYKDAGKFLAGYMDRKRQMDYVSLAHTPAALFGRTFSNDPLTGPSRSQFRPL